MNRIPTLALLAATSLTAACAQTTSAPVVTPAAVVEPPVAAAMSQQAAHDALFALFKQSDEDNLRRNPLSALARGDLRYADQLGNYLTDEYNQA